MNTDILEARDFGQKPRLAWVPVSELMVDARYQRDTMSAKSRALVKRISSEFDWSRFQTLTVADNEDGTFNVIDGQHRAAALKEIDGIDEAPCLIVETTMLADEAASFVGINRDRVRLNEMQLYHAGLIAHDPKYLAMAEICRKSGIVIPRTVVPLANQKPGETMAVKTIARQIDTYGDEMVTEALSILTDAWPDSGGEITAVMIKALVETCVFNRDAGGIVDRDRLIAAIRQRPSEDWQDAGRSFGQSIKINAHKAVRMLLAVEYNKHLRGANRLTWDR